MDVILVDLVADNNQVEGDDAGTVHSLRSLVSSDDSTVRSSEKQEEELVSNDEDPPQCDDYRCSIIACSSPEIKALVQTIPQSVQCRHRRSVSTLSFFPEDMIDEDERDEYFDGHSPSATTTITTKRRNHRKGSCQPLVSPNSVLATFGSMSANDHQRLSINEDRDQESCQSEGRFVYDDDLMSPLSIKSSVNDIATEELARRLERTSIGSTRSTIASSATQRKPGRKRPSMHRRVSYNNLPNMSEIMCHPDFQSI